MIDFVEILKDIWKCKYTDSEEDIHHILDSKYNLMPEKDGTYTAFGNSVLSNVGGLLVAFTDSKIVYEIYFSADNIFNIELCLDYIIYDKNGEKFTLEIEDHILEMVCFDIMIMVG